MPKNTDKMTLFHTKHNLFKKKIFPSNVIEWNMLDPNLRSAASLGIFKKNLLKFKNFNHVDKFVFITKLKKGKINF